MALSSKIQTFEIHVKEESNQKRTSEKGKQIASHLCHNASNKFVLASHKARVKKIDRWTDTGFSITPILQHVIKVGIHKNITMDRQTDIEDTSSFTHRKPLFNIRSGFVFVLEKELFYKMNGKMMQLEVWFWQ